MTNKEAIEILKRDRDLYRFNPMTGERVPMSKDCEDSANALDVAIAALEKQESGWNNHNVACLLAEMFDDDCACNFNGIDEWLPMKCDFAETVCPHPVGVACWEQFLKHRSDEHGAD